MRSGAVVSRPSNPPDLPGFTFVRLLGQGGYADVFLYQQHKPRRNVAVKVILPDQGASGEQLAEEANTMAAVSDHPYIVTIYEVGVANDGRAYLVMEYYPNPNFSVRARSELIPLAEVLRVGVQVASAVETAHRNGILHRDIKPANILSNSLMHPGLTDFGISAHSGSTVVEGLSIPWSAPEVVGSVTTGAVSADVYALGATVYTMLTGRSPFELANESNRAADLVARIQRLALPPTRRADVPSSLERLLQQTMAKDPAMRPPSAAAFARSLQAIEQEFGPTFTPLAVADDATVRGRSTDVSFDAPDATKVRQPQRIDAQAVPVSPEQDTARAAPALIDRIDARPAGVMPPPPQTRVGMPPEPELDRTFVPNREAAAVPTPATAAPRKRGLLVAAAAAVVVVGGAGAILATRGGSGATAPTSTVARPVSTLVTHVEVPVVTDLKAVRSGTSVQLSWTAPTEPTGLRFRWRRVGGGDGATAVTSERSVAVDGVAEGTQACFEVESVDDAGRLSDPVGACAT